MLEHVEFILRAIGKHGTVLNKTAFGITHLYGRGHKDHTGSTQEEGCVEKMRGRQAEEWLRTWI